MSDLNGCVKVFKAWGRAGSCFGDTAREAAIKYFDLSPEALECEVQEGYWNGFFFAEHMNEPIDALEPKKRYRDVTKKQAATLGVEDGN